MRHILFVALTAFAATFLPSCGGGGGGTSAQPVTNLSVTGEILDSSGRPLDGVTATVVGTTMSATSDATGRVTLGLDPNQRWTLKLEKSGYTGQFVVVRGEVGRSTFTTRLRTQALPMTIAAIENGGAAVGEDGVTIELPPNALVMPDGSLASGDIAVSMTPVDVTDPDERSAFPGEYAGTRMDGSPAEAIVSLGTAEYVLRQGNDTLQVAAGSTAFIELPIYATTFNGSPIVEGERIPLWSLDEVRGDWLEESLGTVVASATSPTGLALRGEVTHFSWWNCDIAVNPGRLRPTFDFPDGITIPPIVDIKGQTLSGDGPSGRATQTVPSVPPPGVVTELTMPPGATVEICATAVGDDGTVYRDRVEVSVPEGGTIDIAFDMIPGRPFIHYFELLGLIGDQMTLGWRVSDADAITLQPNGFDATDVREVTLPFQPGVYELIATNAVGSDNATLEVSEASMRDTTAYTGRLAWSQSTFGAASVTVWDMAQSRAVLRLQPIEGEAYFTQVNLSTDGTQAAFTRRELFGLFSARNSSIRLADIAAGTIAELPFETLDPGVIRNSSCPSASNVGTVAFEEFTITLDSMGLPDEQSSDNIGLWDGASPPRLLTNSPNDDDTCPQITSDGGTVVFLSDRVNGLGLWRVSTALGSTPQPWYTDPDTISPGLRAGSSFDLTSDGSRAAFVLSDDRLAVLDEGSSVPRIVYESSNPDTSLFQFSMSRNGSRIVYTTFEDLTNDARAQLWLQDLDTATGPILLQDALLSETGGLSPLSSVRLSQTGDAYAAIFQDEQFLARMDVVGIDSRAPATITTVDEDPAILGLLEGSFVGQ